MIIALTLDHTGRQEHLRISKPAVQLEVADTRIYQSQGPGKTHLEHPHMCSCRPKNHIHTLPLEGRKHLQLGFLLIAHSHPRFCLGPRLRQIIVILDIRRRGSAVEYGSLESQVFADSFVQYEKVEIEAEADVHWV